MTTKKQAATAALATMGGGTSSDVCKDTLVAAYTAAVAAY
jgi:hypothetical protein